MERIPVAGPSITQLEIDYVTDAVTTCWYDQANKYHDRFEKAFAEYIGVRYAVALPSCTSAIHLSLVALGVGSGDEVIVPDVTWIASAAPIQYVGATPVFADIDPATAIGFLYQGAEFAGIFAGMVGRAVASTRLTLGPAQSGSGRGGGCGRRFRKGKAKAASPGRAARLTGGER